MANNYKFHKKDQKLTKDFIDPIRHFIKGERILMLCEGMARNCNILQKSFNIFDICDLDPSFGDLSDA